MIKMIIGWILLSPLIMIVAIPFLMIQLVVCIICIVGFICDYFIRGLKFKDAIENYTENIFEW